MDLAHQLHRERGGACTAASGLGRPTSKAQRKREEGAGGAGPDEGKSENRPCGDEELGLTLQATRC